MPEPAASVFLHLVQSVDPDHFSEVDLPLVEQYSISAAMATEAAQHLASEGAVIDGKANPWVVIHEKATRALVALCARLRVSPQSRFDRLVAGANSREQPSATTDDLLA